MSCIKNKRVSLFLDVKIYKCKNINVKTNIKMVVSLNESHGPLPLQIKCKSVKNVKLWKLKRMVYNGTTLVHKTFTEYYQFMKKTEFKNVMLLSL